MSESLAFLNGSYLPISEARLPLHDAGFVMGATIIDFCRTFRQRLFRWPDHRDRLLRDCAACSIPLSQSADELDAIAERLIAHNSKITSSQELALITFATPGSIGYYLNSAGAAGDGPPTLGMHTFPLPLGRYQAFFEEGIALGVPIQHLANPSGLIDPRIKHRSRLHWWLADQALRLKADAAPGALAVLYDAQTRSLTETAIGNLLLVRDGQVITPLRDTILDGISLRVIDELCRTLGIPFAEARIDLDLCAQAEEAMLCGTAFCVAGVRQIENQRLPWPGPIFQRLLAAWSERVGLDIREQILSSP